jgi:YesN/AraC family two-component response regulator
MLDFKQLQRDAEGYSILHVEDNEALRENASKLLKKFFATVYTASDGKEGLALFKKHNPNIVLTDIKMPHMTGIELAQNIRKISPYTKIIIMSAFDDKEYLYEAIEIGIFRFLKKPVNLGNLTEILHSAVVEIKHEDNVKLFDAYIKTIFNYQSAMVVMMKGEELIFANQALLDFFELSEVSECIEKFGDFGNVFLEHNGFLYNQADKNWFDAISKNPKKLYHVKLKDKEGKSRHFILKFQAIPEKNGYGVLSFDDITELNLLKLFDEKQSKRDENIQDTQALFKLLGVLQRNNAKVHLHNYYRGLSITNDAIITDVAKETVILKTNYLQQKAVQFEQRSLIVSDALPYVVACDNVVSMSFDKQNIEFKNLHFMVSSPVKRKTVRVIPEETHTVSLFLGENKFQGEARIEDISLDAVKLELNVLPAGLNEGSEVVLDLVLTTDKQHIIINTKAVMFRKQENKHSFSMVFMFKFEGSKKSDLVKYITNRQMSIIREFKGLQNG